MDDGVMFSPLQTSALASRSRWGVHSLLPLLPHPPCHSKLHSASGVSLHSASSSESSLSAARHLAHLVVHACLGVIPQRQELGSI